MAAYRPLPGRVPQLLGRGAECGALDRLIEAVRAGESRALVVRGEPGAGKTALLDFLAGRASGCRGAAAAGGQVGVELAVGAVHQRGGPRGVLGAGVVGPLDERVRDQFIAETGGNPLALLELPRGLTAEQLAGGFGLPGGMALPGRIEESFRRRVEALPDPARRLLLLAAAEPAGDLALVWRAAGRLGIGAEAAGAAADAGLAQVGGPGLLRHPLVRWAAYWPASAGEKQQGHRALAEATDPGVDPDPRAPPRAHPPPPPDRA